MERLREGERKQERDGHPSLHTWIRGYRDTDRLKTWLTLLKPCRRTHTHSSVCAGPSRDRGREHFTVCLSTFLSFAQIYQLDSKVLTD